MGAGISCKEQDWPAENWRAEGLKRLGPGGEARAPLSSETSIVLGQCGKSWERRAPGRGEAEAESVLGAGSMLGSCCQADLQWLLFEPGGLTEEQTEEHYPNSSIMGNNLHSTARVMTRQWPLPSRGPSFPWASSPGLLSPPGTFCSPSH